MGVSVATTVAASSMRQNALNRQISRQKEIIDQNRAVARAQAADAMQQGAEKASMVMAQGRRMRAAALAKLQKTGLSTTEGSLPNVLTANDYNADADADRIKATAARRAWGFYLEEDQLTKQKEDVRQAGILGHRSNMMSTGASLVKTIYGSAGSIGAGM